MVGLCRLCASFRKMDALVVINDECNEICQKIRKCCQLNIQLQDTLPKSVCQECMESLNVSHKFFLKVQEAQETLQTLFPSKNIEDRENDSWICLAKTLAAATGQKRKFALTEKEDELSSQDDDKTIKNELQTKNEKNINKDNIPMERVNTKQMQSTIHLDAKEVPIDIKETQDNTTGSLETVENEKYLDDVYNMLDMCKDELGYENTYDVLEPEEVNIDESKERTENSSEILKTLAKVNNVELEQEETIYVDDQMELYSQETQLEEEHLTNENLDNEEGVLEIIDQELPIEEHNLNTQVQSKWCKESDIEMQYIEVVETEHNQQEGNEEIQSETEVEIIENEKQAEMSDETSYSPSQIKSWQSYIFLCIHCEFKAQSFLDLKTHAELKHEITHIDNLQFQCYDCQKIIPKYSFYLNHIRSRHHPALRLQCDVCDLKCENYEHLSFHRSTNCSEANQFSCLLSCTQCFKSFQTTYGLQTHNKQQHSTSEIKMKYQCTYCGKVFNQKSCVKVHELLHTENKKYSCGICDNAFVNQQNLDIHLYSHIEEKTYQCSKCDKRFKTFLTLDRHQNVHSKQKPFKCQFCDKHFRNKSEKLTHERVHTGELPFKCQQCEKRFRFLSALNVHIRNHNGEKPFACDYCDKSFIDTSNRNKHIKRKHANSR